MQKSAPRSRQTTTSFKLLQDGCSSWRPTNSVKAPMANLDSTFYLKIAYRFFLQMFMILMCTCVKQIPLFPATPCVMFVQRRLSGAVNLVRSSWMMTWHSRRPSSTPSVRWQWKKWRGRYGTFTAATTTTTTVPESSSEIDSKHGRWSPTTLLSLALCFSVTL